MICSFKLIIRGTTDTEKKQQKQTPSPLNIEKNIDNFLQQRGNIQTNGTQFLAEFSSKVIEKLLLNVPLGPLSFIPVSSETSRDEFPHKIFKHYTKKAKNRFASSCPRQSGRFFYK